MGYVSKIGRAAAAAGVFTIASMAPMNAADIPVISNVYNAGHVLNIDDLGRDYALAVPPTPTPTPGVGSVGGIAELPYENMQSQSATERNGDNNDVDWKLGAIGYGIIGGSLFLVLGVPTYLRLRRRQ